jgi:hypothetical protein
MSRPEKDSPEWDLWVAAIDVAVAPPVKKGTYSYAANVPWHLVERLRDALDAVGIDWLDVKTGHR